jgi:hypothetical protein
MGYHATFGSCQERGQCECNGYTSLAQCINAYIAEVHIYTYMHCIIVSCVRGLAAK